MKVTFLKVRDTDGVYKSGQMEIVILVNGCKINSMVKGLKNGQTEIAMTESGLIINNKGKE